MTDYELEVERLERRSTRGYSQTEWAKALRAADREAGRLTFPAFSIGGLLFVLLAVGTVAAILLAGQ